MKPGTIIHRVIQPWKVLLVFSLLGLALVGVESCAGHQNRQMTVTAKDVSCTATSIHNDGKVTVRCGAVEDSFTDSEIAISLLKKPQPLKCTLHKAKDEAECSLPKEG